MSDFIDSHHIECSRAARFSTEINTENIRKTKLYLYNKEKDCWSNEKYAVESMNFSKKSILSPLEKQFTIDESNFRKLIIKKINEKEICGLTNEDDKKILSRYLSINLIRNPDNLNAMILRTNKNNDKFTKNKLIEESFNIFYQTIYTSCSKFTFYSITTKDLLVCPDSIIYCVNDINESNIKYLIIPIIYNKYLISSYDIGNTGKNMFANRLDKVFTAEEINNFSYMSDFRYLCADKQMQFKILPDFHIENYMFR